MTKINMNVVKKPFNMNAVKQTIKLTAVKQKLQKDIMMILVKNGNKHSLNI